MSSFWLRFALDSEKGCTFVFTMKASQPASRSAMIKAKAAEMGFFLCGIARAEFMDDEARRLEKWLTQGYHGDMSYMENHFDKRTDPRLLVHGAKSVISLAYNYYHPEKQTDPEAPKISMYAFGKDYHKIVKKKLKQLFTWIQSEFGAVEGRYFVDSAPVLERDWAKRSGIGWVGKNTLLIHPKKGSCFFLSELILDLELEADHPLRDYCGTCTRCIDACPTDAIHPEGYLMDGSRCISYLTIELKKNLPEEFAEKMENWAFGCDICQSVCPWNRFSVPHSEEKFLPSSELLSLSKKEWLTLDQNAFERIFEGSAVKRTGLEGIRRNVAFLQHSADKSGREE
ncbi:MAG: tRNA epoxyqueuosine(34) reductase QueG [Saprospiraceae bacterium]|nr:tRNA epoxyqueuosine(34) reductase QueG [Saprospiraceae bacterium]